jgi:hypothetical chaperone protein
MVYPGAEIEREVSRAELASAAHKPLQRILAAMHDTLRAGGVAAEQVEIACLTGGTSRMPLVHEALRAALPNAGFRRLSSFHSVVQGLAQRARELA